MSWTYNTKKCSQGKCDNYLWFLFVKFVIHVYVMYLNNNFLALQHRKKKIEKKKKGEIKSKWKS